MDTNCMTMPAQITCIDNIRRIETETVIETKTETESERTELMDNY